MSNEEAKTQRLQSLMAAHYEFVRAADLPEGVRPYGVQSRLDTIERQIMEELERNNPQNAQKPPPKTNNDDVAY